MGHVTRIGGESLGKLALRELGAWDDAKEWDDIQKSVRRAAYEVIARKGATCHAIGVVCARLVRAIVRDENAVLPVSVAHEGVSISIPTRVNRTGAQSLGLPAISPRERDAFAESVSAVRAMCRAIGADP